MLLFSALAPPPNVTVTSSSSLQEAMVGNSLTIECMVGADDGVESSSVMISWMGPGGDTITSDSRVTISGTTGLMSTLNFMYLMEGDEGTYRCNVMILETSRSASVELETLTSES